MKYNSILLLTVISLFVCSISLGQDYSIFGYTKYLYSSTSYPGTEKQFHDHLLHSRINSRLFVGDHLTGAMEFRFRCFAGDSPAEFPDFEKSIQSEYEFNDMDAILYEGNRFLGYAEIDRLYLDFNRNDLQITFGRQRIAWGTTLVWNITDLFNPMSILEFDYEEKPGADALRVQYFTGPVSRMEMVVQPGKDKYGTTVAGLWTTNTMEYDFFLLAALQQTRWVLGGAWAGAILDGGFRGELKLSESPSESNTSKSLSIYQSSSPLLEKNGTIFSATMSGDYTFTNSFYVHTEVLYNSNGLIRDSGFHYFAAQEAGMLSPSRWSLFQEFAYDLTPIVRTSIFSIWNPNDHSSVIVPMADWSVITNWDLTLVGIIALGKQYSEFGDYGTSGFVRIKYSF